MAKDQSGIPELSSSEKSTQNQSGIYGEDLNAPDIKKDDIEEISIKEIILTFQIWFKYLLSKYVIIICCGLLGAALGLYYSFTVKPVYIAEISFVLENGESGGGLGGYSGLASMIGIDLGGGGGGVFEGDNLIEFMRSRSMIERTLLTPIVRQGKKETLAEIYIDINGLREGWQSKPQLKDMSFSPGEDRKSFSRAKDSVLASFYKVIIGSNLSIVKLDKKLNIVIAKTQTGDEFFSKAFTETLVKEVSDFYVETKTKKSAENLYVLQRQTDSVRRELNLAISGVASSVDINPNPNPSRRILGVPSQRRQVDVQANQAILTELVKNLEIAKVSLRRETPLIQVIDSPILPLNKVAFGKRQGVMAGGLIGGFLIVLYLILNKLLRDLLK